VHVVIFSPLLGSPRREDYPTIPAYDQSALCEVSQEFGGPLARVAYAITEILDREGYLQFSALDCFLAAGLSVFLKYMQKAVCRTYLSRDITQCDFGVSRLAANDPKQSHGKPEVLIEKGQELVLLDRCYCAAADDFGRRSIPVSREDLSQAQEACRTCHPYKPSLTGPADPEKFCPSRAQDVQILNVVSLPIERDTTIIGSGSRDFLKLVE
jgi:hypothetical protein